MKTSELTGAQLDWAVAKCEVGEVIDYVWKHSKQHISYSIDWAQGGPLIEREEIEFRKVGIHTWLAETQCGHNDQSETGPTPLIAAMRCYVASKLGDDVEIPKELTE